MLLVAPLFLLASPLVAATPTVGGVKRRGASDQGVSYQEKAIRAARQYDPRRRATAALGVEEVLQRRSGPSDTPCPVGSENRDGTCVSCASLGRQTNTVAGQPCGPCLAPFQVIGDDGVCRAPACNPPLVFNPVTRTCTCPINTQPGPSTSCTSCVSLHRLPSGQYGTCGGCEPAYVDVAGTCVAACPDPSRQDPVGGCRPCTPPLVEINGVCVPRTELVRNGGFETNSGPDDLSPAFWSQSGDSDFSGVSTTQRHAGSAAYRLGATTPLTLCQTIPAAAAGLQYTLSVWVFTTIDGPTPRAGTLVGQLRVGGSVVYSTGELKDLFERVVWQRLAFQATAPASSFQLCFVSYAPVQYFYIDDVSLI